METGSSGSVRTSRKRRSAPLADHRDAAVGSGDRGLTGSQADQLGQAVDEVVAVGELLPDQLLGLELVRGDDRGAGPQAGQHRLALGVEDRLDAALAEVARRVARRGRRPRRGAGEPASTQSRAPVAR